MSSLENDGSTDRSAIVRNLVNEFEAHGDEFDETYDRFARSFCDNDNNGSEDLQVVFESVPEKLTGFSFDEYLRSNAYIPKKAEDPQRTPDILDLDSFNDLSKPNVGKNVSSRSVTERLKPTVKTWRTPETTVNVQKRTADLMDKTVLVKKVTRGRSKKSTGEVHFNWAGLDNFSSVNTLVLPENHKFQRNRLFVCYICNSRFVDSASICQHVVLHNRKQPVKARSKTESTEEFGLKFLCGLCHPKREFNSGVQLKEHIDKDHKRAVLGFACGHCKTNFITVEAFQRHVLNFHWTQNMTKSDQKNETAPSQSPVGGTDSNYGMKPTKGTVPKQQGFVCVECGEVFNTLAALKWHTKESHEFSRPFECTQCEERFRTESGRARHELVAHFIPEKSKCTECPATFNMEEELKVHVQEQHLGLRIKQEEPTYFDFCMNPVSIQTEDQAKTSYFLRANPFSLFGADLISKPAEQISRIPLTPKISAPARRKSPKRKLVTVNGETLVRIALQKLIAMEDYSVLDGFTPIETAKNGIITFSATTPISADRQDYLARLADVSPNEIPAIPSNLLAKWAVNESPIPSGLCETVLGVTDLKSSSTSPKIRRSRLAKVRACGRINADSNPTTRNLNGLRIESPHPILSTDPSTIVDVCETEYTLNAPTNQPSKVTGKRYSAKFPINAIDVSSHIPKETSTSLSAKLPSKTSQKKRSTKPPTVVDSCRIEPSDSNHLFLTKKIRKSPSAEATKQNMDSDDTSSAAKNSIGLPSKKPGGKCPTNPRLRNQSLSKNTLNQSSIQPPVVIGLCDTETETKVNNPSNLSCAKKICRSNCDKGSMYDTANSESNTSNKTPYGLTSISSVTQLSMKHSTKPMLTAHSGKPESIENVLNDLSCSSTIDQVSLSVESSDQGGNNADCPTPRKNSTSQITESTSKISHKKPTHSVIPSYSSADDSDCTPTPVDFLSVLREQSCIPPQVYPCQYCNIELTNHIDYATHVLDEH